MLLKIFNYLTNFLSLYCLFYKLLFLNKFLFILPINFVLLNEGRDGEDLTNLRGVIDNRVHGLFLKEDGVLNFIFSLTLGPFLLNKKARTIMFRTL